VRTLLLLLALTACLSGSEEFFDAARKGDAAKVRGLLDQGVDVNAKWRYGQTALLMAAWRGRPEVVKVLLERGAAVDVKDTFYGMTPLQAAAGNGQGEIVGMLLEKGAAGRDEALVTGAQAGHASVVKAVLARGSVTPDVLKKALAAAKNPEITELLKQAGAQ
jgi:ankyrin repeat protein